MLLKTKGASFHIAAAAVDQQEIHRFLDSLVCPGHGRFREAEGDHHQIRVREYSIQIKPHDAALDGIESSIASY
jgi:hypothetical protein